MTASAEANKYVDPIPGFVLKTRRGDGSKVFVNICHHASVPQTSAFKGSNRWPFMLASVAREWADGNNGSAVVYDIVVHSAVMDDCLDDETHNTKDMVRFVVLNILYITNSCLRYFLLTIGCYSW